MCLALFMVLLDNTVVNVALPAIQQDLGSTVSDLQWIVNSYTLLFASLMLTAGTLGDLFGRRRVMLGGLLLFTVASVLCGVAPNVQTLVLARALQGAGAAALLPTTLAIVTATFPDDRERAQAIGIWAGVSALALAAGPILGGVLTEAFGWQSVFFVNLPVGIVAMVVGRRVIRESARPGGRRLDVPGLVLGALTLGALTYALIEAPELGWGSPVTVGLLVASAAGLVAFLAVERRTADPMLPLRFFRNSNFTVGVTVAGLAFFGLLSMLFFLSLYFQEVRGYSPVEAGIRFLALEGAIVFVAPVAGRLASRIGSRLPMTVGMALTATGLLLLTRLQPDTSYGAMWWNLTLMGVGMGLTMAPVTAAIMATVPATRAGMASAVSNTARQVGAVCGVALLGAIVTSRSTSLLSGDLAAMGVTGETRARVLTAASRGLGEALPAGLDPEAVRQAVNAAYVGGMRTAVLVAGLALLGAAVLAAVFMRPTVGVGAEEVNEPEVAAA
jgi:EmrB/QacA subfamily drug resistance transporter